MKIYTVVNQEIVEVSIDTVVKNNLPQVIESLNTLKKQTQLNITGLKSDLEGMRKSYKETEASVESRIPEMEDFLKYFASSAE